MPGLRRRAARVRGARGGAHRQWQAVHRPVRQGRGGAVRPDLPRQWHHPPAHRAPASATTGKVERFHGSLRRELLDDAVPFADLAAAQTAVDAWRQQYNTTRPHQALGMASPAERFTSATGGEAERLLPLRLPAILSPVPATQDHRDTGPAPVSRPAAAAVPTYDGGRWSSSGWSRPAATWRSPGASSGLAPAARGKSSRFGPTPT